MTLLRDANGQTLAYVYFEDEPGRRSAAHLRPPSCSPGAKPGASPPNIAKLPDPLRPLTGPQGAALVSSQSTIRYH